MSDLTFNEKTKLEKLFQMGSSASCSVRAYAHDTLRADRKAKWRPNALAVPALPGVDSKTIVRLQSSPWRTRSLLHLIDESEGWKSSRGRFPGVGVFSCLEPLYAS